MACVQVISLRVVLSWICMLGLVTQGVSQIAISYCSPENNAGSYPAAYAQYQSNGWCSTHCQGSYAYAVLQGSNCWCSNYAPAVQVDTLSCNQVCPGIGTEWCGSTQAGLYGYYQLSGGVPLGTSGTGAASASSTSYSPSPSSSSSSPTTSSVSTPSSSSGSSVQYSSTPVRALTTAPSSSLRFSSSITVDPPQTSVQQYTYIPPVVVSSQAPSSSSPIPVSTSVVVVTSTTEPSPTPVSTSAAAASSSYEPSPATTQAPSSAPTQVWATTTISGTQVRTVLVTPSSVPDGAIGQGSTSGHGVSSGKVAGIVVGVAIGCGLLIGFAVWAWYRHKHRRALAIINNEDGSYMSETATNTGGPLPSRQVSQLSSAGLLAKIPRINTSGVAAANNPRSAGTNGSMNFDRMSIATDQRLNPYALYAHEEGRQSAVSLQDNQDYSRQLKIANPDHDE